MRAVTGVYTSLDDASLAVEKLVSLLGRDRVNLLTPLSSHQDVEDVPTTDDMPHVGGRLGGILGGALGVGTGLLLPGVGFALGAAAAALLGIGGSVAGYKVGDSLDRAGSQGLPVDELYVYEDALCRGRSVVIALVEDQGKEDSVRTLLEATGAESLDAARDAWWVGIRDDLEAEYEAPEGNAFAEAEPFYRRGFQAALIPACQGQSFEHCDSLLRSRYGEDADLAIFRRGYERGQQWYRENRKRIADSKKAAIRGKEAGADK